MADYSQGDAVTWHWGGSTSKGRIVAVFHDLVQRTIKGAAVTRDATTDEPAYLIRQDDGDEVLKSGSEISRP